MDPEELAIQYTQLHGNGQHEEANQLALDVLVEQNLTPRYNLDNQTFSFVDVEKYENGYYS